MGHVGAQLLVRVPVPHAIPSMAHVDAIGRLQRGNNNTADIA